MAIICLQFICAMCTAPLNESDDHVFVLSNPYDDLNRRTTPFQERARELEYQSTMSAGNVSLVQIYTPDWRERKSSKPFST